MKQVLIYTIIIISLIWIGYACHPEKIVKPFYYPSNSLNYTGTPDSTTDRSMLAFSDQGAWFAYSFPTDPSYYGSFSGPFLMTQNNGVWCSKALSQLKLVNAKTDQAIDLSSFDLELNSYNSHLEQIYTNEKIKISQLLFYVSAQSALIISEIENLSGDHLSFSPSWSGSSFLESLHLKPLETSIDITSDKSLAKGMIQVFGDSIKSLDCTNNSYTFQLEKFDLKAGETKQLVLAQSFTFPDQNKQSNLAKLAGDAQSLLQKRIAEKQAQLAKLYLKLDTAWNNNLYKNLIAKSVLTLQNNWRAPAGQLNHSGIFPSYHYIWFHGFWAWDSWKHAVALAYYDPALASEQIEAMYDYQMKDGFIPDCIYRDTTDEKHNYRNTKPPLSAWAVWKVYQQNKDLKWLASLYPKIIKQHEWWYLNRDHDKDSICEFGSTDGSLIAAKWESGMDNAVRFDKNKILKNSEMAYSLDQESVDLNAYLYAEKNYLIEMAKILDKPDDIKTFTLQAEILKKNIQKQFFDPITGWFYDTSIDGEHYIEIMGCEGWIPLWANVASSEQAEAVKNNMMNPEFFNTQVPFQTLSASDPNFEPYRGYWRGPNWLDQSYFGVKGLEQYGYHQEAYEAGFKLMHNAEGVLGKGASIRENYQPITGEGLESESFSWSAAHYLLLLIGE